MTLFMMDLRLSFGLQHKRKFSLDSSDTHNGGEAPSILPVGRGSDLVADVHDEAPVVRRVGLIGRLLCKRGRRTVRETREHHS